MPGLMVQKVRKIDLKPYNCFQANKPNNEYVDASNFRQEVTSEPSVSPDYPPIPSPIPEPPRASPLAFQPETLGLEFDKAYYSSLDAFVHDF